MRVIERYISKSIIINLIGTLLVFMLLFILIDSASNLDEYINRQVSITIIMQYYLWFLPVILQQTMAIAYLIACLLTYAALNSHNEIIALRSSGLTFWKLARPALTIAMIISAAMFYLNENYIPRAETTVRMIKEDNFAIEADHTKKLPVIHHLTFYGMQNRLYFIDAFDPNTKTLSGITIIAFDSDQNIKEKIVALEGTWTGIVWKFKQCHITPYGQTQPGPTRINVYEEKLMDIKETPDDFIRQQKNVSYMNMKELRSYIQRFANSGATRAITNLRVDMHSKIAYPFTTLIIILLGLPLVIGSGKRQAQTFTALGIAVMIGFLYYVLNAVGLAMGKGDILPPVVAAWMAPAFFSLAAFYIIRIKF